MPTTLTLEAVKAYHDREIEGHTPQHLSLDCSLCRERWLLAQVTQLREAVRGMMLSADASWIEHGVGGHDWREAYQEARDALAALGETPTTETTP